MSLFSFGNKTERFGTVIDIGSGSVMAAIVCSRAGSPEPIVIWSHREHAPLRSIESLDQSAKAVLTALVNVLLRLDVEGRRTLYTYQKAAKITELQCAISAPWSYTISKTISYNQEEPFEITEGLIEELIGAATKKMSAELSEGKSMENLGLAVVARTTMDLMANGYRVKDPFKEKASSLTLSHSNVAIQQYLVDEICNLQDKLFPSSSLSIVSYMLAFYSIIRDLFPDQYDVCLVDITYEATELGIVRDGTLTYSTHTAFGAFSLAREIAEVTGVPLHEAFQYLHCERPYAFMEALSETKRADVEQIFEAYTERVAQLFHETGDELSIPKIIYLHTDLRSEQFFSDIITKAAKRRLKSEPVIQLVTSATLKYMPTIDQTGTSEGHENDTALTISAQFFHKQGTASNIKYK